jgi:hypothetical protein
MPLKSTRTTKQRTQAEFDALPEEERLEILKNLFYEAAVESAARMKAKEDAERAARLAAEAAIAARHRHDPVPAPSAPQPEVIVAKPEPRADPSAAIAFYDHQLRLLE